MAQVLMKYDPMPLPVRCSSNNVFVQPSGQPVLQFINNLLEYPAPM